jgi:folate-dependent phosphoribosylglycinamide formyltransferase PurN
VVAGVVNLADEGGAALLEDHGVRTTVRDVHAFYEGRDAPLDNIAVREAFDAGTADVLAEHDPDLVVLAGYLHVLTAPMLDRYPIVSAHHADLTIRDASGAPVYTGLHAVEDAVRGGEAATRETTHVVTETVDAGPVIVRSPPFPVHRDLVDDALERDAADVLDAYVYAHRQWMVRAGGGPTLAKTVELIADGRVTVDDEGCYSDGRRGYYQLGEGVVGTESPEDRVDGG